MEKTQQRPSQKLNLNKILSDLFFNTVEKKPHQAAPFKRRGKNCINEYSDELMLHTMFWEYPIALKKYAGFISAFN